ncbi:Zn-dependent metalloprotease [Tahibacter aquaticus]|uniref:Zn-dependent metalloprotease n=1 Tax=Tahibacter aquaticus TaxID=520092 RepID=A0A4R6Z4L7_9GAMM|nr:PepSY domain-containing protein [Tahibacter aquaticus]TDR46628.1 Zn-dependent metalloprotease [Tahibacter aquaticus]
MQQYRNILGGAVAAALLGLTTSAMALSPESIAQRESMKVALAVGVDAPAQLSETAKGQFRADGSAAVLFVPQFKAKPATAKAMTLEFLAARGASLGLSDAEIASLAVTSERQTDAIGVVRVQQSQQGLPVYGSDIAVTSSASGEIIFVASDKVSNVGEVDTTPALSSAKAIDAAAAHLGGAPLRAQKAQLMVHVAGGKTHLVWRTNVSSSDVRVGGWEVLVDAHDGSVLRAESTTHHIDGSGTVWAPDPLSSAKVAYATAGYPDNNNADSPQLTAQLVNVTLRDITLDGANHKLSGPFANCWEWEAPTDAACPVQASTNFSVTRSALTFDAVMVYHHVDSFLRYTNQTLGVVSLPTRHYTGGVRFDPHGEAGDDNSHYDSGTGELVFGEGGVDDAQDADVIVHELGHGIHDWITNGGLSQTQGLSEGTGDYLAQAWSRDYPNQWAPGDTAYNWTFSWDGHNPFWAGRVTNWQTNHTYPGNLGSGIHAQGQYWASCNHLARTAIGGQAMDKAFLVGLSGTTSSSNQKAAAQAVINAAAVQNFANVAAIAQAYNTSCTYAVTVPTQTDAIFQNGFQP